MLLVDGSDGSEIGLNRQFQLYIVDNLIEAVIAFDVVFAHAEIHIRLDGFWTLAV